MTPHERSSPCLDLGCGAGELLVHLRDNVNITVGLDYSKSMLEAARQRLGDSPVQLLDTDLFAYISTATQPTWITTGAVNQYLDPHQTEQFLQAFSENTNAKSLFLFDCVDPLRYAVLQFGSRYPDASLATQSWRAVRIARLLTSIRRTETGFRLMFGMLSRSNQALRRHSMGFAYLPNRWRDMIEALDLDCEFVSSLFYEYRFHVIVRKRLDVQASGLQRVSAP